MSDLLHQLKIEAKILASKRSPRFYTDLASELSFARSTFFDHPLVQRCREDAIPFLSDQYGHGIEHSKLVAIEASAIALSEGRDMGREVARHLALLSQIAGLLHDVCRMEDEHALRGAELSRIILQDYPLSDDDRDLIAYAVNTHEAFKEVEKSSDPRALLLSGVLYDADKFRWGPDNFATTLWEICDYQEWPLAKIVACFPEGLKIINTIASTFRTSTGKQYGPEFIEIGLEIGSSIYRRMVKFCKSAACDDALINDTPAQGTHSSG